MWFKDLMGFEEKDPWQVRNNIRIRGNKMISMVNGAEYIYGELELPLLEDLRKQFPVLKIKKNDLMISEITGDIRELHKDPQNYGAVFQVASQFNLLEMASPHHTPEMGVGIYEHDHTQGPACAISCGAGTIYRNYFVPVNGKTGQSEKNQVNCLKDLEKVFFKNDELLWNLVNGYVFCSASQLNMINAYLEHLPQDAYEYVKGKLRIGVQWNTQVTLKGTENLVTQAYCSALPVTYNTSNGWERLARLILEATYETTFYTALSNYRKTGNPQLFLTLVGGGVFGNKKSWILKAIESSVQKFKDTPLKVKIVSYRHSDQEVNSFIKDIS